MTSAMLTKTELREQLLRQRRCVEPQAKRQMEQAIAKHLMELEWFQKAKTVFLYVSTSEEISTRALVEAGWKLGKCVCVPKCLPGHRMEARRITSWADLTEQTYGIPEPGSRCQALLPEDIDLCLVPALACDRWGHRLGYGGGFYDRFLPQIHGRSLALCAAERLIEELPADCWDVPCDGVVTEDGVFYP